MEIWKDIIGYEGYYQVSNLGNIKSLMRVEKILLKNCINHKGYCRVPLSKNGKRKMYSVHRLVAEAFIPNPKNKPQVNHKDCNKKNNNVSNLEWCTDMENHQHAKINHLKSSYKGSKNNLSKLKEHQVLEIKEYLKDFNRNTCFLLGEKYNVSKETIRAIKHGKTWKHLEVYNA